MVSATDFDDFFAAVNDGRLPFSWQKRLVDQVLSTGQWPDRIIAPTGSGKSSVVEIHVFVTAVSASTGQVRPPRRLVAAVDRRALVDNQLDRAQRLRRLLDEATEGVLQRIRVALRSLTGVESDRGQSGLHVVSLRGGQQNTPVWRDAPDACGIICATPDMWGSRVLFRGYGTSMRARPRDAGLLAVDAVLVLDEAHLNKQLLRTARRIGELQSATDALGVPSLQVVETTATPSPWGGPVAGVDIGVRREDIVEPSAADKPLATRLLTPKPIELVSCAEWPGSTASAAKSVAQTIAERARSLKSTRPGTVGVFVNTVNRALDVAELLRTPVGRSDASPTVVVVVGPMRPYDRSSLRDTWPGLLDIKGNHRVEFLVATQTLEVGADLDLPAAVSELAPAAAITQRAGRVNRLGEHADPRIEVVVPESLETQRLDADGPYTREELAAGLAWLRERNAEPDGLSPWWINDHEPPATSPKRQLYQRLEAADAALMAATSQPLFDEFDLDLWLHDELQADHDQCFLVARERLPVDPSQALAVLNATPPRSDECFPASMRTLRELLFGDRRPSRMFRFRGSEFAELTARTELRPGDIVIVDSSFSVVRESVVHRSPTQKADDVYELDSGEFDVAPVRIMPFADGPQPDPYATLLKDLGGIIATETRDTRGRRRDMADLLTTRLDDLVAVLDASESEALVRGVRRAARALVQAKYLTEVTVGHDQNGELAWVVITPLSRRLPADLRQIVSTNPDDEPVSLEQHSRAVAHRAARLARAVGVQDSLVDILEWAGRHHDDGKRDLRFQNVLRDPDVVDDRVLAKSRRRRTASARQREAQLQPSGWRHEQLSAVIASAEVNASAESGLRSLGLRLIGTSHGHGRHVFPHAAAELIGADEVNLLSDARWLFDRGGWDDLIDATDARFGVWGCAYLEALLRAADCQISSEGS